MAVAARCFEFDKTQRDELPIREDASLMFSIVKVAQDQPMSLLCRSGRAGTWESVGTTLLFPSISSVTEDGSADVLLDAKYIYVKQNFSDGRVINITADQNWNIYPS